MAELVLEHLKNALNFSVDTILIKDVCKNLVKYISVHYRCSIQ